jgi:hypothetical protein
MFIKLIKKKFNLRKSVRSAGEKTMQFNSVGTKKAA